MIQLPTALWMREDSCLASFDENYSTRHVRIHPLKQSAFVLSPDTNGRVEAHHIAATLRPMDDVKRYEFVRMDGQFVCHADLLQIDFFGDGFERRSGTADDPNPTEVERVTRDVVRRLRYTLGAPWFREFPLHKVFWVIRYLADDESELPETAGFVRIRGHAPFEFIFTGFDEHSWHAAQRLGTDFTPLLWESLHLDARFLLPEVGPAIVLAYSAIEAASEQLVRQNALSSQVAQRLLKKRVPDRLDIVASQLIGTTLKADPILWQAFDELRRARNSFAHAGRAMLNGTIVDEHMASALVDRSEPVLRWIESHLPAGLQTSKDPYVPVWEYRAPLTAG